MKKSTKILTKLTFICTDDEADSQTEGEELDKARAIRMQEAKVKPVQYLPTDTETEVCILIQ